jgi:hypothetical protein
LLVLVLVLVALDDAAAGVAGGVVDAAGARAVLAAVAFGL